MKKVKILLVILCLCLTATLASCDVLNQFVDIDSIVSGMLGDALNGNNHDHTCEFVEWETIIEPTCSEEGEEISWCEICFEEGSRPIEKLAHTPETVEALAPTCTEAGHEAGVMCSECGEAISGAAPIAATGHTERVIPPVEATDTTLGKTEGKECSVCGIILVYPQTTYSGNYTDHNKYDGDYAYNSLASLPNGAAMQEFYWEIDAAADAFHVSSDDALENTTAGYYYAATVTFSDNGISATEALSVWKAYSNDHPLYYWMSRFVRYSEAGGYINIQVDEEYITAEVRQSYNSQIYATVKEYVEYLNGESEIYAITEIFAELMMRDADYAYLPDGVTPSDEVWAHNLIGVMLNGEGVCESYAKTYQLLLNYVEAECIFVGGQANGGAHAWNMVKLDNGEWYIYDITWEDIVNKGTYFCQTEMSDHFADAAGGEGTNYTYTLPETADAPYAK